MTISTINSGSATEAQARASEVMDWCDRLATLSEEPDRLTRRFATPALGEANAAVLAWMHEAGMDARQDAIGNVVGRYEGTTPDAPVLLLGSHLDSVRDAGRYDGPLGVLCAIAAIKRLHRSGRRLPYAIEVLGFADEEGVRYNTAYLGSSVVAGTFDPAYLDREDDDGVTMRDAIRAFGGDPERLSEEQRDRRRLLGYCEIHIEQGPVLEAEGLPVGVVSAIAGQSRINVVFSGEAGHAGTVPMELRRDALAGAAEWMGVVERRALDDDDLVATVGALTARPGASNVIPGRVELTLDVRSSEDSRRVRARDELRKAAERIAAARRLAVTWELKQETGAVSCSPRLTEALGAAVRAIGHPVRVLPSGAGHDAAALAALTDVAMLFVRCAGGISHNPAESVAVEDVAVALDTLNAFLGILEQRA